MIKQFFVPAILLLAISSPAFLHGQGASRESALQSPVVIYLQPDTGSPSVGTTARSEQLRSFSLPVEDEAKAAQHWRTITRPVALVGFVANEDIGKDLNIRAGAPVRRSASQDADVLFTWSEEDTGEYGDVFGRFTQISVRRPVPVYFQLPPAPEPPAAAPATPTAPAAPPRTPRTLEDGQPIAPPITSYQMLLGLPLDPEASRYYVGTFRPYRTFTTVRPDYRFELLDGDGRRIAFVNMEEASSTMSFDRFYNRRVMIFGSNRSSERRPVVFFIDARMIRLQED